MSQLKVYDTISAGRYRRIVAAKNRAEAARLMGMTPIAFRHNGGETGIAEEIKQAMMTPGVVWEREYIGANKTDWRCLDPLAGAKAMVLARFPEAKAIVHRRIRHGDEFSKWAICTLVETEDGHEELAAGETEETAWLEAGRLLSIKPPEGLPDGAIVVWRFQDAPQHLRDLSPHGGDKDWVAWIPEPLASEHYIGWLEAGSAFGCSSVSPHYIQGGMVRIGAHA